MQDVLATHERFWQSRPCSYFTALSCEHQIVLILWNGYKMMRFIPFFFCCRIGILSAFVSLRSYSSRTDRKTLENSGHILHALHQRTSTLLSSAIGYMILEHPSLSSLMPISSPLTDIAMNAGQDFHKGYTLIELQLEISGATKVEKEGLLESRRTLLQIWL